MPETSGRPVPVLCSKSHQATNLAPAAVLGICAGVASPLESAATAAASSALLKIAASSIRPWKACSSPLAVSQGNWIVPSTTGAWLGLFLAAVAVCFATGVPFR